LITCSRMAKVREYIADSEAVLPDEGVDGEPFWVLMEVINGRNTGNYHSIGKKAGKYMVMLFPQKSMARWAAGELQAHSVDYAVRGVSALHLQCLLSLVEDGHPLELLVAAAGLDEQGKLQGVSMRPEQIRQLLEFPV